MYKVVGSRFPWLVFQEDEKVDLQIPQMLLIVILLYDYIQNFEVVGYAYANMLKDRRAYDKTVETSVYVRFEPPITIQLLYNVSDQFGFVITIGLERDLRQYKSSTKKLLGSYQSHFSNWSIMKCCY